MFWSIIAQDINDESINTIFILWMFKSDSFTDERFKKFEKNEIMRFMKIIISENLTFLRFFLIESKILKVIWYFCTEFLHTTEANLVKFQSFFNTLTTASITFKIKRIWQKIWKIHVILIFYCFILKYSLCLRCCVIVCRSESLLM